MFKVITEYPLALDSPDYQLTLTNTVEGGPIIDNSRNHKFNEKLYELYPNQKLYIMDLGCSGGGFIKDCVDDGHFAIGLEGTDYSFKHKRAEWNTIPNNLFTCDVTKPFQVYYNNDKVKFDVITAWEFMEHINEKDLHILFTNIINHLKINGLFICSISTCEGPPFHQTIQNQNWWMDEFIKFNLINKKDLVNFFETDFVRIDNLSFHMVLQYNG